MTDRLLWKRGPWRIYKQENKHIYVKNVDTDKLMHFVVYKTHWGYPLSVGWQPTHTWENQRPTVPEYVEHAIIQIYKRKVPKRLLR